VESSSRIVHLVCLGILALCLIASGVLSTALAAEAGRSQLVYSDQVQDGDPPEIAVGIAMGAFRGLFVNYLWLRATKLKEEGKFYEAIELSSAITRLQPRFPRVWAFHSWNMAYNISVATNTPEERWEWVNAGIRLLRDEGIPKNPNDVLLHKELAWIFVHKIQSFTDDANRFYKRRLAREWAEVLGQPPILPEGDSAEAGRIMSDWFRPIVTAPGTLQGVIDREIAEQRDQLRPGDEDKPLTSKVAELVERLRQDPVLSKGQALGIDLLRYVTMHEAYKGSWYAGRDFARLRDGITSSVVNELRDDPAFADAWNRLLPHVRRRVLIDTYRMEPDRMLRYMGSFGPLDWRHPASHALYWSQRGVEEAFDRLGQSSFDTLNTDRVTVNAIQELWRTGTIIYDPITDEYVTLVNLHFTDVYGDFILNNFWERHQRDTVARTYELNSEGFDNFLRDVIRVYFRMGRTEEAEKYFQQLRKAPWRNTNDDDKLYEISYLTLEEFVRNQFKDDRLSTPHVAAGEVSGALRDAYFRGLLRGNMQLFKSQFEYAQMIHRVYFEKKQTHDPLIDAQSSRMEEMPRDFMDAASVVFLGLLMNRDMEPINAAAIFQKVPEEIQRRTYDRLSRMFVPQVMSAERFTLLFPEPSGMAAHRAQREAEEAAGRRGAREQLQFERQ